MKSALFSVAWNADDWTFEALKAHYKTLVRYLNLNDQGMILGYGCGNTFYDSTQCIPYKAYQLGRNL